MKKNLISIIILALLIVNIVLTALMMFSVTSTNKKTADLITRIAGTIDMEVAESDDAQDDTQAAVSMADTQPYTIADSMTIPLKRGADGKEHYYVVSVALSMNKKDKDYKTYGEDMESRESLIKSEIVDVIGSYTLEEIQADTDAVRQAVLERIQQMFDSEFIYNVAFSDVMYS